MTIWHVYHVPSYTENPVNSILKPLIERCLIFRFKKVLCPTEIDGISRMCVDNCAVKSTLYLLVYEMKTF